MFRPLFLIAFLNPSQMAGKSRRPPDGVDRARSHDRSSRGAPQGTAIAVSFTEQLTRQGRQT